MTTKYVYYDRQNEIKHIGEIEPITTVATGYEPDYMFTTENGNLTMPVYSSNISPVTLDVDLFEEYIANAESYEVTKALQELLNRHVEQALGFS